jgi:hypothetical protein
MRTGQCAEGLCRAHSLEGCFYRFVDCVFTCIGAPAVASYGGAGKTCALPPEGRNIFRFFIREFRERSKGHGCWMLDSGC